MAMGCARWTLINVTVKLHGQGLIAQGVSTPLFSKCHVLLMASLAPGVCPRGKAWFSDILVDNTAHEPMTCSNRGFCDEERGECVCQPGFSGAACERCRNSCC